MECPTSPAKTTGAVRPAPIDVFTASELRLRLLEIIGGGDGPPVNLVLDLSGVGFIGTAATKMPMYDTVDEAVAPHTERTPDRRPCAQVLTLITWPKKSGGGRVQIAPCAL